MSFSDYASFRTAISAHLNVSDVTTTTVDDLIKLGEVKVNRKLRARAMESVLNATIAADGTLALPSAYLALKHARIDGTPTKRLKRVSLDQIYESYPLRSSNSKPQMIAREGSNFIFGPFPDSQYVVKGIYYSKPTSMADGATINAVFTEHPDCYFFAALSEAEPMLGRDARIAIWEQKWQAAVDRANEESDSESGSGSDLAVSVA